MWVWVWGGGIVGREGEGKNDRKEEGREERKDTRKYSGSIEQNSILNTILYTYHLVIK